MWYSQVHGRDYDETYSPTVRLSTIRVLLAVAAQAECRVRQMDVKTEFLNADIEEEVFLHQPDGFEKFDEFGNVLHCKLKKALYGLKQAGRNWYLMIAEFLKSQGFVTSKNDHCLFVKTCGKSSVYVAMWVHDLIYFSLYLSVLNDFEAQLESALTISEKTDLHWILGMCVEFGDQNQISLSQEQYIVNLLKRFGMEDC